MKPEQITAWALDEASAEERQQLEAALLENPQDKEKADETKAFCDFLLNELRDDSLALTDKQRERLVAHASQPEAVEKSTRVPDASETLALQPPRKVLTKWNIGIIVRLAVAACVALGGFWTWQTYSQKQTEAHMAVAIAEKPGIKVKLPQPDSKKKAGEGAETRRLAAVPVPVKAVIVADQRSAKPLSPVSGPEPAAAASALALNKGQRAMTLGDVEQLKRIQDQNAYGLSFDGKPTIPAPAAAPKPLEGFTLPTKGGLVDAGTGMKTLNGPNVTLGQLNMNGVTMISGLPNSVVTPAKPGGITVTAATTAEPTLTLSNTAALPGYIATTGTSGTGTTVAIAKSSAFGTNSLTVGNVVSGASLSKNDAVMLNLGNASNYTGDTTVSGGVMINSLTKSLATAAPAQTGTGAVALSKGAPAPQTENPTMGGIVSESGAITQIDTGALVLAGANTYSGGTSINSLTLSTSNGAAVRTVSDAPSTMKRTDGATFNINGGALFATTPSAGASPSGAVIGGWAVTNDSDFGTYSTATAGGANSESDKRYYSLDTSSGVSLKDIAQMEVASAFRKSEPTSGESYTSIIENELKDVAREPLSTLSIDVDTASYSNVRRFLNQNMIPPPDAVRIEELVNYFPTSEEGPEHDAKEPFGVRVELAPCPWQPVHRLARIAIKGREMDKDRKASNLVFLVDVSGSMNEPAKLPLVQQSLCMLTEQLGEGDRVTMVVYAGSSGVVLPPTGGDKKAEILAAIGRLSAGGSTHGSAGIKLAYEQAVAGFIKGGVNRVILCTDGDFNVGVNSPEELEKLIKHKAKSGVFLSVLGFGSGNLQDRTMETLADKGNGNYAYIDSLSEARKVLVEQMGSTLVTIAKDVKIQVEFNPAAVSSYRLIGYENRLLAKEDFNDDTKDAGEIGAGHSVVALYEIVPANLPPGAEPRPLVDSLKYQAPAIPPAQLAAAAKSGEMMTVKLRYKEPDSDLSKLIEVPTKDEGKTLTASSEEFKFSAAVAGFGLLLRDSSYKGTLSWETVRRLALDGKGADKLGYRGEFLQLIDKARGLKETR